MSTSCPGNEAATLLFQSGAPWRWRHSFEICAWTSWKLRSPHVLHRKKLTKPPAGLVTRPTTRVRSREPHRSQAFPVFGLSLFMPDHLASANGILSLSRHRSALFWYEQTGSNGYRAVSGIMRPESEALAIPTWNELASAESFSQETHS